MGRMYSNRVPLGCWRNRLWSSAAGPRRHLRSSNGRGGLWAGLSACSASKAAVIGLAKSLGKELAEYAIAVNAVTPAAAQTPILEQVSAEFIAYMLRKIPRGRFVEVPEIVSMALRLLSRENSFSTAAMFDISGGRAIY